MYSPKIREDLIPYLYKLRRHLGIPMTKLVSQVLEQVVERFKQNGIFIELEQEEEAIKKLSDHFERLIKGRKTETAKVIELLRKIA
jgi:L-2-hydroxyglutarate oxidase LhgO